MKDSEWWRKATALYEKQHGKCGACGAELVLSPMVWPRPQLAHKIKRGEIIRELGKEHEWDIRLLVLVCPNTKVGHDCNSGALLGEGHPLDRKALFDEIRGSAQPLGEV